MYHVPDQSGRLTVVTGATSGTGREAARRLAGAGGDVVLAVRSEERGEATRREILGEFPRANLRVRHLNLAELASVRRFSDELNAEGRAVDVLINNAGVMTPRRRIETPDGFELQLATNFLGHFALTLRLLPSLLRASAPRVVTMSSLAATVGRIRFDDLQSLRRYTPFAAYAQSKLAELFMAQRLSSVAAERAWPLTSVAAHPGFTRTNLFSAGTNLGRDRPRRRWLNGITLLLAQDVTTGVEPLLVAATSADVAPGAYYGPNRLFGLVGSTALVRPPRSARSRAVAQRLWRIAEELTGESLEGPGPA